MNAAAKVIHQSTLFNGHLSDMRLSKEMMCLLILLFAMLMSAIAVIYITNVERLSYNHLQQLEQQQQELQLEWGQLLLEQASLATPARVEAMAVDKLHMKLPSDNDTFILQPK